MNCQCGLHDRQSSSRPSVVTRVLAMVTSPSVVTRVLAMVFEAENFKNCILILFLRISMQSVVSILKLLQFQDSIIENQNRASATCDIL